MEPFLKQALRLVPQFRDYVWGGRRLRPDVQGPTAEAWVVFDEDRVAAGPLEGRQLKELAAAYGADLLGERAVRNTGLRFPLLIKLLDVAAWLSVQVHPNDEQAVRLEGAGFFGKTEAWHILEADPGAELLCGLRPGATAGALVQAVRGGGVLNLVQSHPVRAGETFFIHPGLVHALGPGILAYEVQQTSDLTYRVYDWDRPPSEKRRLHLEQSLAVIDTSQECHARPSPALPAGGRVELVACEYFRLELLGGREDPIPLDTRRESFHAVTVIEGQALLEGESWSLPLGRFETALIPAACGGYQARPVGFFRALNSVAGDNG